MEFLELLLLWLGINLKFQQQLDYYSPTPYRIEISEIWAGLDEMRWPQFKGGAWMVLRRNWTYTFFLFSLSLKQMNTCDTSLRRSIVVLNTTNCLSHTCKAPKLIEALHQRHSPSPSFWSCALLPPPLHLPIWQILQLCFCTFQNSSQLLLQSFLKRRCHELHPQDLLHPCPWNWPKNINDENKQLGTYESIYLLKVWMGKLKLHLFHNSFDFVPGTLIGIYSTGIVSVTVFAIEGFSCWSWA